MGTDEKLTFCFLCQIRKENHENEGRVNVLLRDLGKKAASSWGLNQMLDVCQVKSSWIFTPKSSWFWSNLPCVISWPNFCNYIDVRRKWVFKEYIRSSQVSADLKHAETGWRWDSCLSSFLPPPSSSFNTTIIRVRCWLGTDFPWAVLPCSSPITCIIRGRKLICHSLSNTEVGIFQSSFISSSHVRSSQTLKVKSLRS